MKRGRSTKGAGQIIAISRGNCLGYFLRGSPLIKDDGRSDSRPAAAPAAIRRSLPSVNSPSAHGQARTRSPRASCPSGCRGGRALCFSLRQRTLLLLCRQCLLLGLRLCLDILDGHEVVIDLLRPSCNDDLRLLWGRGRRCVRGGRCGVRKRTLGWEWDNREEKREGRRENRGV